MNIVLVMTDSQRRDMVGCYGKPAVDTPNLERLASEGVRFDCAYNASPVCTPARGSIFSGLHPQVNGAYCNNVAPHSHIPLIGTIFGSYGYRTAYSGKWHLDGSSYFGDGVPGGGFEPDWWYDSKGYAEDIGPVTFSHYKDIKKDSQDLRKMGFTGENIWGHRVADRAIDFLQKVGTEPFVLAVSFDEPHGPYVAPPQYWEGFNPKNIQKRDNFAVFPEGKPELQKIHAQESGIMGVSWDSFIRSQYRFYGCNSYIDREIGRVLDAVESLHQKDTIVIYTSDHGDMQGSHCLKTKGPMMYEEITRIPFIVKLPGSGKAKSANSLVSHIDILPTMLDYAGLDIPESMQGISLRPILEDRERSVRDFTLISWNRFAINHDMWGEFYPIRCATDGRYKLSINLFDTDELYDLEKDPYELSNLIYDSGLSGIRNCLHDFLIAEMDRIRDPFRTWRWASREWRKLRKAGYYNLPERPQPEGFSFQPRSV